MNNPRTNPTQVYIIKLNISVFLSSKFSFIPLSFNVYLISVISVLLFHYSFISFLIFDLNYYGLSFLLTLFQLNCMMCSYGCWKNNVRFQHGKFRPEFDELDEFVDDLLTQYSVIHCFFNWVYLSIYSFFFSSYYLRNRIHKLVFFYETLFTLPLISLRSIRFSNVFEWSLICWSLSKLHLFDQKCSKNSNIVKY